MFLTLGGLYGQYKNEVFFEHQKPIQFQEKFEQISDEEKVLLDVRTAAEYHSGRMKSAKLLDYYASSFWIRLDALDKNKTYFVYCRSGNRSGQVLKGMKKLGFKKVVNLQGGFISWRRRGLPFIQ